ncbi:hypothetical protein EJF36_12170 [Bacillus sp. HMF5848]|uniref:hypothetical protein n=1 Tax=Bacillus sp. HMF5848 TaxID=2495421 RepID=UPI000F770092|nr:hypothetical protein [Bacillus sp. HMF5848]RSK27571.1 hypothetical protein EJF36_12170 [Bacillus sp. HMF5848]
MKEKVTLHEFSQKLTGNELYWFIFIIYLSCCLLVINHIYGYRFTDSGTIITIMFGITSGLLGLMGLVAIFVSLNMQHKIQTCRELYWQMVAASRQEQDPEKISRDMSAAVKKYGIIFSNEDKYMSVVISVSQKSIMFVIFSWIFFVSLLGYDSSQQFWLLVFTILGIYILLHFHRIIGRLKDIQAVGELKELTNILDIKDDNEKDVESVYMTATNLRLKCFAAPRESRIGVYAYLLIPISNFHIKLRWVDAVKDRSGNPYEKSKIEFTRIFHAPYFHHTIQVKDYDNVVAAWQEKGTPYLHHEPLFYIEEAEQDVITFNENTILVPKRTGVLDLAFTISNHATTPSFFAGIDPYEHNTSINFQAKFQIFNNTKQYPYVSEIAYDGSPNNPEWYEMDQV